MNDVPISAFEKAIRVTHRSRSRLLAREQVHERFAGELVWQGEVLVFELLSHPSASLCYAWEVDGEVTTVLGEGPITSAADAVRASIMAG